ncbi:copper resistance protein B [Sphingomonas hankookensis]|uniref:copper resistance protein B n=1 Tax=Sphingomonas hankookensis TaxID=563996 RepID=UPI001F57BB89|nr:copper resistance protein B [Sphingomonas hankookensis]
MTARLALLLAIGTATPAWAQDHAGHGQMDHSKTDHGTPPPPPADPAVSGTDLPPGDAPAPPVPMPHAADGIWGADAMANSRKVMMADEGGGQRFAQVLLDRLEWRDGGYRWEGEGWFGGDLHRLVVKSEGEGKDRFESAEVQALYSHAVGPYFNLQAGVRHDSRPTPKRSYAVVGVEGLAPYWFEVEAHGFLSTRGELTGRVEGYYDQRITQRLIAQPRAELNLSAQDVRDTGLGSGLTSAELGLRLRYEIAREFAPYVGVAWERRFGDTRRFARARGADAGGVELVAGIRAWF